MAKNEVEDVAVAEEAVKKTPSISDARDAIFGNNEVKTADVKFRGVDIELRQPSVTQFLSSQGGDGEEPNAAKATIRMIVQFAYLKGTDQRVFEPTDVDALAAMPMSGDFFNMIQKMNDLLDIKVEKNVKN